MHTAARSGVFVCVYAPHHPLRSARDDVTGGCVSAAETIMPRPCKQVPRLPIAFPLRVSTGLGATPPVTNSWDDRTGGKRRGIAKAPPLSPPVLSSPPHVSRLPGAYEWVLSRRMHGYQRVTPPGWI